MSGNSYSSECPKCGERMDCYSDSRQPDSNYEICWKCGYEKTMQWVENQMTKEELIDRRIEAEINDYEYNEYVQEIGKGKTPLTFEEWTAQQVCIEAI